MVGVAWPSWPCSQAHRHTGRTNMGSFDKLEAVLFDLRDSAVADVTGFDESVLYACNSRYTYKTTRSSVGHLTLGSHCAA